MLKNLSGLDAGSHAPGTTEIGDVHHGLRNAAQMGVSVAHYHARLSKNQLTVPKMRVWARLETSWPSSERWPKVSVAKGCGVPFGDMSTARPLAH